MRYRFFQSLRFLLTGFLVMGCFLLKPAGLFAYDAAAVLGQSDTSGNAIFTSNLANNQSQDGRDGFFFPDDAELDYANNRMFLADNENNRVLVFGLDSNNQLADNQADFVLGQSDFVTTTAGLTATGMRSPMGVSYDQATNYLYVADAGNVRVLVFDVATIANGEAAVNVLGQPDFLTSNSVADQSSLVSVEAVEVDSTNQRLFVSDTWGARLLVFDVATITNGEAATNVLGQANFTATGIATTSSGFRRPSGTTFDSVNNRLYVADRTNNRIMIFDTVAITNGEAAVNVLGQTIFTAFSAGTTSSKMNFVNGVALDVTGNRLFASDELNRRVLVFDVATITNGEAAVNVLGQADFVSGGLSAVSDTTLGTSQSVLFDSDNNFLYVVDRFFNRVLIFDAAAIVDGEPAINVLGQTDSANLPIFDNRSINNANESTRGFAYNTGVVIDEVNHRLFVADSYNARILIFNLDANNQPIDLVADFVLGQSDFDNNYLPDFDNPQAGDIFQPSGLAFDEVKNLLYVADRSFNRVLIFDTATIVNGEAAVNVLGQADFVTVFEDLSATGLYFPQGIALDQAGQRLFVSDEYNTRVVVFDVATIVDGEAAVNVLGQTDFVSATADLNDVNFNFPLAVAYYEAENWLFVADSYNNRVLVFDVATIVDGEAAIHVLGQADFVTANASAGADGMNYPAGLGVDSDRGLLYVSDGNSRVLIFDLENLTDGEDAVMVLGQPDFNTTGAVAPSVDSLNLSDFLNFDAALFYEHVKPVTVDSGSGRIYVSESFNHRVTAFDFISLEAPTLPDATINAAYNFDFVTNDDQGAVEYELVSGALPLGVSLSASGVTGTPLELGTFNFAVRAVDDFGVAGEMKSNVVNAVLVVEDVPPVLPPVSSGGGASLVILSGGSAGGSGGSSGAGNGGVNNSQGEDKGDEDKLRDYETLDFLVKAGIITGYADGYVYPENFMNRAELVKILIVAEKAAVDFENDRDCFVDVDGEWFGSTICYARRMGLVAGYGDGFFRPGQNVTKAEALRIIMEISGLAKNLEIEEGADWYAVYLREAERMNLTDADFDRFFGGDAMRRGDLFEVILRALVVQKSGEKYNYQRRLEYMNAKDLDQKLSLTADFKVVRAE